LQTVIVEIMAIPNSNLPDAAMILEKGGFGVLAKVEGDDDCGLLSISVMSKDRINETY